MRITIGPSRILAGTLTVAHAVGLAVVLIVTLPVWAKLLLGAAIAASCAWSIYSSALLRAKRAIVELEVGEGASVSYRVRGDIWRAARLLDSSFVSPRLTVLNLRPEGGRLTRHLTLLPDNVDADAFRRLRVLLRWSRARDESQAPSDPANTPG